jgi:hypothetical protein
MGFWPVPGTAPALFGVEGELVLIHIAVEPRLLEDLLEALAKLDFPVNPDLTHKENCVTVTFPAYSGLMEQIRGVLAACGFDTGSIAAEPLLAAAHA